MDPIRISYRYLLDNGDTLTFPLLIDGLKLHLLEPAPPAPLPDWARLEVHQCPNCPLKPEQHPFCPVAVNLIPVIDHFDRLTSFDELDVTVTTDSREYQKRTRAQEGISSLMGLLIAASDCPRTLFFKPMARFHLPFSTREETIWRATSIYMLSQYFRHLNALSVDESLAFLEKLYREIQQVNSSLSRRLRPVCADDCALNAIIILDIFAKSLPLVIDQCLDHIYQLFSPYIPEYIRYSKESSHGRISDPI